MSPTTPIEPLEPALASLLRSQTLLPTLPDVLRELVQNALDAKARHIAVVLDLERWSVRVDDDGTGIDPAGLAQIGTRYGTSKSSLPSLALQSTFGFRGEALASLAAVSLLEVVSATTSSSAHSCIIKGGKRAFLGPSRRFQRTKPGSTVLVKDLFYNLNVRRKAAPSAATLVIQCRRVLETASLLFPDVSFALYDRDRETPTDEGRVWGVQKTSDTLSRFGALFGVALIQSVTEISTERDGLKLEGFISLNSAHSKAHQTLFVNRHPLSFCELHKTIDARFARSGFARLVEETSSTTQFRRSPKRSERKPVYVLSLTVPPEVLDRTLEPSKSAVHFSDWSAVTDLLSSTVDGFLMKHRLFIQAPRVIQRLRDDAEGGPASPSRRSLSPSPRKKPPSPMKEASSSFQTAQQQLVADPTTTKSDTPSIRWRDPISKEQYLVDPRTGHSQKVSSSSGSREKSSPSPAGRLIAALPQGRAVDGKGKGQEAAPAWLQSALQNWQNPTFPSAHDARVPASSTQQPSLDLSSNPYKRPLLNFDASSAFFSSATKRKEDSVVPSRFTREDLLGASVVAQVDTKFLACVLIPPLTSGSERGPRKRKRLRLSDDKEDENAGGGGGTLVLLDQHAVDERIRVERLLRPMCEGFFRHRDGDQQAGVPTTATPGLLVLLTRAEYALLSSSPPTGHGPLAAFARWGIRLRLPSPPPPSASIQASSSSSTEFIQIHIDALPSSLSIRLSTRPPDVANLIKASLARWDADPSSCEALLKASPPSSSSTSSSQWAWMAALRHAPPELLDGVNSRACRGAIMFNDPLTTKQAETLVEELAGTGMPFQCAHGRPSLVPLVTLKRVAAEAPGAGRGGGRMMKSRSKGCFTRTPPHELDWETLGLDG